MIVRELIEKLKNRNGEIEVLIEDNEDGSFIAIGEVSIEKATDAATSKEREFVVLRKPLFHGEKI